MLGWDQCSVSNGCSHAEWGERSPLPAPPAFTQSLPSSFPPPLTFFLPLPLLPPHLLSALPPTTPFPSSSIFFSPHCSFYSPSFAPKSSFLLPTLLLHLPLPCPSQHHYPSALPFLSSPSTLFPHPIPTQLSLSPPPSPWAPQVYFGPVPTFIRTTCLGHTPSLHTTSLLRPQPLPLWTPAWGYRSVCLPWGQGRAQAGGNCTTEVAGQVLPSCCRDGPQDPLLTLLPSRVLGGKCCLSTILPAPATCNTNNRAPTLEHGDLTGPPRASASPLPSQKPARATPDSSQRLWSPHVF